MHHIMHEHVSETMYSNMLGSAERTIADGLENQSANHCTDLPASAREPVTGTADCRRETKCWENIGAQAGTKVQEHSEDTE